jgi:hypothetical protein
MIRRTVIALTAVLTCAALVFAVIGVPWTSVSENSSRTRIILHEAPQSWVFALATLLICFGELARARSVAWTGWGALAATSALFVFGIGLLFAPIALILLVLLPLAHRAKVDSRLG